MIMKPMTLVPPAVVAWPLLGVLVLVFAFFQPAPALAQDRQTRDICLCRQVIARTLCKRPDEVEFIDRYMDDATYSFTVFYAKKPERFICNVSGNEVRIKGKAWSPLLRTVRVTPSTQGEGDCMDLDYFVPECPRGPVRCCEPRRAEDVEREKELDFWNRPIPDLLEDELSEGIAAEEDEAAPQEGEPEATQEP